MKRSGIKAKRNTANLIPQKARTIVRQRDADTCVRCLVELFGSGEWHHRRTRAVRDDHRHCPCVGVMLCSACHRWVHAHPAEARQVGLIVSRHESKPFEVPFRSGEVLIYPFCSGNVNVEVAVTQLVLPE